MEELLKKYIESIYKYDIYISYYTIEGAECDVVFYTDESHHYREEININIWDMLLFLNVLKTN